MTSKEINKQIREMKKFTKKVGASKALSKKFLVEVGLYTEKGNLRKPYRG